jgi:hypothetical protein
MVKWMYHMTTRKAYTKTTMVLLYFVPPGSLSYLYHLTDTNLAETLVGIVGSENDHVRAGRQ